MTSGSDIERMVCDGWAMWVRERQVSGMITGILAYAIESMKCSSIEPGRP